MTRLFKFSIFAWVLIAMAGGAGCGGGLTQKDMMRNAIRRPSNNDDAPPPATHDKKTQVAASATTTTPDTAQPDTAQPDTAQPDTATPDSAQPDTATTTVSSVPQVAAEQVASLTEPGERSAAAASTVDAGEPLSAKASRKRAIDQMARIAEALEAHAVDKGYYPAAAILGTRKEPMLSWRVALLPFLGHAELYARFKLDEPWNSKHNQALVAEIPSVFEVAGVERGKTNFLLPAGPSTVFAGHRGVPPRKIEDGAENTVILLEVDRDRAVAWSAPRDHRVNLRDPTLGLGAMREGGFLIVWGGGTVNWVTLTTPIGLLRAIFTPDAGDGIVASQVGRDPLADLKPINPDMRVDDGLPTNTTAEEAVANTSSSASKPGPMTSSETPLVGGLIGPAIAMRHAVPSDEALRESKELVRDLFHREYRQAASPQERHALAKKMLGHLEEIDADITGQYVLMDTVRQISIQSGAVETALEATREMSIRFEIDSDAKTLETLVGLARSATGQQSQKIADASMKAYNSAFVAEHYDVADQLCGIALAATQKTRNSARTTELQRLRQEAQAASKSHELGQRAIRTLDNDPSDEHAATLLGKYLCLIRRDWTNGLAILAKGDDPHLTPLAKRELEPPLQVEDQVELGDGWWREGEKATLGERRSLMVRAMHWYRMAAPNLSPGLARVKVERRLRQFEENEGSNAEPQGIARKAK